jgi:uncharacterized protein (DUF302 family)
MVRVGVEGARTREVLMPAFDYTVSTAKTFDEAVRAVEQRAAEKGFRVLHTHDIAATLAEKGFPRAPLKIIEICNARYASEVLKKDVKAALLLPCPVSVYTESGKTHISTMLPTMMVNLLPQAGLEQLAREVEDAVRGIVDAARE